MKKSAAVTVSIGLVLLALLPVAVILALCVGKYPVSPGESLSILLAQLLGQPVDSPEMTVKVVMGLRVPRILASVTVGASLAVSGAAYQGIFRNPLISPDFLGVSSGACIGAAAAILLSLTSGYIQLFAFLGGILAVAMTLAIPAVIRNHSNIMLVLSGIIVGSAMSSVLGFIKYVADPETELATITYWTMGSFSYVTLGQLLAVLPSVVIPAALLLALSWRIDVISLGEEEARTLGVNVRVIRGVAIICATLLTASSVCVAGTISWVGLVIPHFGRMLTGPNNTRLLPVAGLMGGLFMLVVDTLTRTIGAAEMPVSILTGIIGAPFYAWLLWRQRRGEQ